MTETNTERLERIKEKWKDVKGYEGCYQISNAGEVKSFKHDKDGRLLSPKFNGHYNQIRLCKEGTCKMYSIHRLVAIHFVGNPHDNEQVNHIDGNKTNNFYRNLEWVTHSENGLHAYKTKLRTSQKGDDHGRSKLTRNEALAIYFLSHTGEFEQREIAEMFNIHLATVSDIKLGKRWGHVTNIIKQAERVGEQQKEIEELQASCRLKQGHINHIPTIRKEYEEENARLREALEHIKANSDDKVAVFIARKTLAGETK